METICHQKKLNEPKVFFQKPKEKTIEKHEKNHHRCWTNPPKDPRKTLPEISRFWPKIKPSVTMLHLQGWPGWPLMLPLIFPLFVPRIPTKKKRHPPKKCGSLEHLCSELSKKTRFPSWSFQQSSEKTSNWNIFPKWGWKKTCLKPPPVSQFMGFGFGVPFGVSIVSY